MPVKAGPGGRGSLLLWKWPGCSWRLSSGRLARHTAGTWAPAPPAAGLEEEESLRLGHREGVREGLEDEAAGEVVLSMSFQGAECKFAAVQLLPQHLLTHPDPREIPTFLSFFFFFKVQKALCCPRERIFGQAVERKGGS